jgi:isopenicillin N synthase-like dioxygenase
MEHRSRQRTSPTMGSFTPDRLSPEAQLRTICFSKLLHKDREEQARLLDAVETDGFFYLDLTHKDSMELYKDYEQVLCIMKSWFDQPVETKAQFAYNSDVQG